MEIGLMSVQNLSNLTSVRGKGLRSVREKSCSARVYSLGARVRVVVWERGYGSDEGWIRGCGSARLRDHALLHVDEHGARAVALAEGQAAQRRR